MDNDLLILLSRFSVTARKQIGAVNPAKLFKDKEYAKVIFELAATEGNEELVMMSLNLQTKLGLLTPVVMQKPIENKREDTRVKYMYGARG